MKMDKNNLTVEDLVAFSEDIKNTYESGKIRGPVHLHVGAEKPLIEIFKTINPQDWVFSTHRSQYHALLKSKDPEWVKKEILAGNSQHLNSAKYKIFTSAIVGGVLPIAVGTALGIKLGGEKRKDEKVYAFCGDMASEMGLFYESVHYAEGFDLPIQFIVEDNTWGVNSPTKEVWGKRNRLESPKVKYFDYQRVYPHHGVGKFITFSDEEKPHDGRLF